MSESSVWTERNQLAIVHLQDILVEGTSKIRKSLLGVSVIVVLVVAVDLVPESLYGVPLDSLDRSIVLLMLAVITLYFWVSFVADGYRDYMVWSRKIDQQFERYANSYDTETPNFSNVSFGLSNLKKDERHIHYIRFALQIILPMLLGIVAFIIAVIGAFFVV